MPAIVRALWGYLTLNAALLMLAAAGLHSGGLWWLATGGCVALIGWRVGGLRLAISPSRAQWSCIAWWWMPPMNVIPQAIGTQW